jgi:thermostable 8-oxoguanine DNA glycosylase
MKWWGLDKPKAIDIREEFDASGYRFEVKRSQAISMTNDTPERLPEFVCKSTCH